MAPVLVTLLALAGGFLYGYLCNDRRLPPYELVQRCLSWSRQQPALRTIFFTVTQTFAKRHQPEGRWHRIDDLPDARTEGLSLTQRRAMSQLRTIGYLSGTQKATGLENVTTYDQEQAYNGLNLYTSGHAQQAFLIDMKGSLLHTWACRFRDAFPNRRLPESNEPREHWRRAYLYENGDLLAIYEGVGMLKLDKDSNLIWGSPIAFHHDLFIDEEGNIVTPSREPKLIPRIHEYEPILEDFITVVDPDGNLLKNFSILDVFERSSYASCLKNMPKYGDVTHTNTIEVLDGSLADKSSAFKKGNVIISVLTTNVIAVVDMQQEEVVWALSGQWSGQHQPTFLNNGNILLFDNFGHYGMSKVIEFNPFTQETAWTYEGTPENGFHSRTCGSNQRFPNGNTLITQSDSGRAFEVTADKRVVWEYFNPARTGENNELIATLFEVVRLPPDFPTDWLDKPTN